MTSTVDRYLEITERWLERRVQTGYTESEDELFIARLDKLWLQLSKEERAFAENAVKGLIVGL